MSDEIPLQARDFHCSPIEVKEWRNKAHTVMHAFLKSAKRKFPEMSVFGGGKNHEVRFARGAFDFYRGKEARYFAAVEFGDYLGCKYSEKYDYTVLHRYDVDSKSYEALDFTGFEEVTPEAAVKVLCVRFLKAAADNNKLAVFYRDTYERLVMNPAEEQLFFLNSRNAPKAQKLAKQALGVG